MARRRSNQDKEQPRQETAPAPRDAGPTAADGVDQPPSEEEYRLLCQMAAEPEAIEPQVRLARLYAAQGDHALALAFAYRVLRCAPEQQLLWHLFEDLADVHAGQGDSIHAVLARAAATHPDGSAVASLFLAYCRHRRHRHAAPGTEEGEGPRRDGV